MKRLSNYDDINVDSHGPFSDLEIVQRHSEYQTLPTDQFIKKYRDYLYKPASIVIEGTVYPIQLNFCNDPFCRWYGLAQQKYTSLKGKPSRYKIISDLKGTRALVCNDICDPSVAGVTSNSTTRAISNWSVVEEIKRLIKINSVCSLKSEYNFHKEDCALTSSPTTNPKDFYKRGKSTSNSQKYQCKLCGKMTNVLPDISQRFNYNQTVDGVLIDFANAILSRTPVTKICKNLKIGPSTYYQKLEQLYKRCLEFNEFHEAEALKKKQFSSVMLNTDMLVYHLNNNRLKGKGGTKRDKTFEKMVPTYLIASSDVGTGYVFRSDICYDYDVDLESFLFIDTANFHCDKTYSFLRKNERLQYPYYPKGQNLSSKKNGNYQAEFESRLDFVEGCHVKSTYTCAAHMFLIKQMINTHKWYFVSDNDAGMTPQNRSRF